MEESIDFMNKAQKLCELSYGKQLEMYTRASERRSISGGAWKAASSLSAQMSIIGLWRVLNS